MSPEAMNPYGSPSPLIERARNAKSPPIGLLLGLLFAFPPFLLLVIQACYMVAIGRASSAPYLALFLGPISLHVVYGWWWQRIGLAFGLLGFIVVVMIQGILVMFLLNLIMFLILSLDWGEPHSLSVALVIPNLVGLAISAVWLTLLGISVRFCARRYARAARTREAMLRQEPPVTI